MKWMHWSAAALLAVATLSTAGAKADELTELETARGNARAGGPISEHEAWLLERHGALSGTPGWSYDVYDPYVEPRRSNRLRKRWYRD